MYGNRSRLVVFTGALTAVTVGAIAWQSYKEGTPQKAWDTLSSQPTAVSKKFSAMSASSDLAPPSPEMRCKAEGVFLFSQINAEKYDNKSQAAATSALSALVSDSANISLDDYIISARIFYDSTDKDSTLPRLKQNCIIYLMNELSKRVSSGPQ